METSEQNGKLTTKQIRILQILLLIIGGGFLLFYLFLVFLHTGNRDNSANEKKKGNVYYQNQRLVIGQDTVQFKNSADMFAIHGDYLIVSKPFTQTSSIYSLKEQKKVKDIKQVVLDFDGANVLYNEKGIQTFFNGRDLKVTCFGGYIKSSTEILCIVPKADDNLDNKLISLNPQTMQGKDIYSSKYTLSYVTAVDGTVYIGGYSLQMKETVLIVDGKVVQVPSRVALVYKKAGNIYFASLQDKANNTIYSYYQVLNIGSTIDILRGEEDRIVLQ